MLTKGQKLAQIENGEKLLAQSQSVIFVDFGGKSVEDLKNLRRALRSAGGIFKVIKKKLLRIVFERKNIPVNPEDFALQAGTIFASGDITTIAGPVHKSGFPMLGGYDAGEKKFFDAQAIKFIGQLPPREALLGQLVGMLAAPIKMFMFALNERSKKS